MQCYTRINPKTVWPRYVRDLRRCHNFRRSAPAVVRSGLRDEVEQFNVGTSPLEQLSGEANTVVTDVMDIDRTPELLAWVFGGILGTMGQKPAAAQPDDAAPAACNSPASPAASNTTDGAAPTSPQPQSPAPGPSAGTMGANRERSETVNPRASPGPGQSDSPFADDPSAPSSSGRSEVAVVGGGCFWCTEACFRELQGVVSVTSGYAGGHVANPTYQQVLTKTTGHAEVVKVEYDPAVLSYRDILQVFMSIHDPTTPNRSGNDVGPQYRSIILTTSDQQRRVAEQVLAEANRGLWFGKRICTELTPLEAFFPAEPYHQRYYSRNPGAGYCVFVVRPKLQEFRRKYAKRLRQDVSVASG